MKKQYTDEEIKQLFPRQAKTEWDIGQLRVAIHYSTLENCLEAAGFEQVKSGEDVYLVVRGFVKSGVDITCNMIGSIEVDGDKWTLTYREVKTKNAQKEYYDKVKRQIKGMIIIQFILLAVCITFFTLNQLNTCL